MYTHELIIMGDFNIIINDPKPYQLNILINQLGLTRFFKTPDPNSIIVTLQL